MNKAADFLGFLQINEGEVATATFETLVGEVTFSGVITPTAGGYWALGHDSFGGPMFDMVTDYHLG